MSKPTKAVVVFSGGQDSTTCLFWAKQKYEEVIALSFDYGQKHVKELECAKKICKKHGIEHHILDMALLNQLAPNSLTRADIEVDHEAPEEGTPNSFVDGRNMLFLTFAAVFAKQRDIQRIYAFVIVCTIGVFRSLAVIIIKIIQRNRVSASALSAYHIRQKAGGGRFAGSARSGKHQQLAPLTDCRKRGGFHRLMKSSVA